MEEASYHRLMELLTGTKKVKLQAGGFRSTMLNTGIGTEYQVSEFVSVNAVADSEFDFEIKCDGRTILAHYSRFNKTEDKYLNPFARYSFFVQADALPGAELAAPTKLLEIEFGRAGEFVIGGESFYCRPSEYKVADMRNQVILQVIEQLQNHIDDNPTTFEIERT